VKIEQMLQMVIIKIIIDKYSAHSWWIGIKFGSNTVPDHQRS